MCKIRKINTDKTVNFINSIQFNSIQFNSIQFNSIQVKKYGLYNQASVTQYYQKPV
jgi:hypothetical protein